jgi:hypothetical protein
MGEGEGAVVLGMVPERLGFRDERNTSETASTILTTPLSAPSISTDASPTVTLTL